MVEDGREARGRGGGGVELAGLPGLFVALREDVAVIVDFHGVFPGLKVSKYCCMAA